MKIKKHTEIRCDICGELIPYNNILETFVHYNFNSRRFFKKVWTGPDGFTIEDERSLDICPKCMEIIKEEVLSLRGKHEVQNS